MFIIIITIIIIMIIIIIIIIRHLAARVSLRLRACEDFSVQDRRREHMVGVNMVLA